MVSSNRPAPARRQTCIRCQHDHAAPSRCLGPTPSLLLAHQLHCHQGDLKDVQQWLTSSSLTNSWSASHKEWADVASDASGKQLGRLAACLRAHAVKLPTLMLLAAAISRLDARHDTLLPKWAIAVVLAGACAHGIDWRRHCCWLAHA